MIERVAHCGVALMLCLAAAAAVAAASPEVVPATREARFSATALYNLGNAYARAGRPGMAVLNYERASLLAPNDPDIDANLRSVRAASHLPSAPRSELARLLTVPGAGLVSWLALGGGVMAGVALLAARVWTRYRRMARAVALLGIAPLGLVIGHAAALWPTLHAAVVVTNAASVRVSPVPLGDPLFTLAEGETVTLTAQHERFLLVRTGTGRTGWVSGAEVVPVVPRASLP